MLQPCPMLENPALLPKMVHAANAKSTEYVTPEDVDHLSARTTPYAKTWAPKARELWLEEHPSGKMDADAVADMDVDEKAKILEKEDQEGFVVTE